MNDTQLYKQILGITSPWQVSNVTLDTEKEEVEVFVEYRSNQAPCPKCNKLCKLYDHREQRRWRHLDTCQLKTFLTCQIPRIDCAEHEKKTIDTPWAHEQGRFTLLFEKLAIDMLLAFKKQTKVADMLRISFDQINYIMHRSVKNGLKQRDAKQIIKHIGIDEKSYAKRHKYASVLVDLDEGRVIDLVKNRDEQAAQKLIEEGLSEYQRKHIKAVSMDMWKAYIKTAKKCLPQADTVHDHFHLMKYLNKSVDETRRQEMKKLNDEQKQPLKHNRFVFLSNPLNMSDNYKMRLINMQAFNFETSKAWRLKENFKLVLMNDYINDAKYVLSAWVKEAKRSKLKPVIKVAEMFVKHSVGILNYVIHKITNSMCETMNSLIQEIKYTARGFRRYENFRISVLFFLGKLKLYPQTFQ
jgi:transposase